MNKLSLVAVSLLFISSGALVVGAHDYKDNDLKETKQQLTLEKTNGLKNLEIIAERGHLKIIGDDNVSIITVDAVIGSENGNDYELSLTKHGDTAVITAKTDTSMFSHNNAPYLNLVVRVPSHLVLNVNDGSGNISIDNMTGNVSINDGSGSIHVNHVGGALDIKDGSGSINIDDVAGNVSIKDGR